MSRALGQHWFLIGLATAVLVGIVGHEPLSGLSKIPALRNGIVFVVLLVMMLPLPAEAILRVVRRPFPALLASFINMGLIPPLAWVLSPLLPVAAARGLIVAAATPCTVASAAVWTRKAGGNDAVAVLVTVITNVACFVITPAWVWILAGQSEANIALAPMVVKLGFLVLLPMVLAQALRLNKRVASSATKAKSKLGIVAQSGILLMVFIGAIKTGDYLAIGGRYSLDAISIGVMILLVTAIHLVAWISGWGIAGASRIHRPEKIAVAFSSSQKTLLVGLTVAIEIEASILPMVAYHVSQLVVDTLIADRLAGKTTREGTGTTEEAKKD